MKFTLSWLKRFLATDASISQISLALNSIGIEVDEIIDRTNELSDFIVGVVQDLAKHPDADTLSCCKVSDGINVIDIVTGAANVRKGLKVVIAPVGSIIPSNRLKMEKKNLRGIPSYGMLCSESELLIGENSSGIMELAENVSVGKRFIDAFPEYVDPVIDVSITPNRGDCLSVYGIARDLAAYGIGKLKQIELSDISHSQESPIKISIQDVENCPLFVGRYFSGVQNQESPRWLKILLAAIGENSISALVDITNYMNYSFGRPLHVYDANKIKGNIRVRFAEENEIFKDLKDRNLQLNSADIVIADNKQALGLAGIIGGDSSKCDIDSTEIYLESAVFNPINICKSGRRLNIHSEARTRFERGVDHEFSVKGAIIASNLIQEICGGKAGFLQICGNESAIKSSIEFNLGKVKTLGGIDIGNSQIKSILTELGFECSDIKNSKMTVIVPSWRHDIHIDEDLVEEILRIHGYDNIPSKELPRVESINAAVLSEDRKKIELARILMASQGYDELVTFSFMSSKIAKIFNLFQEDLCLANPMSSDLDILRKSITPNLLGSVSKNNLRSFKDLSFFEIGTVFRSAKVGDQKTIISGVRSGYNNLDNIYKDSRKYDFFDVKQDVKDLLSIWNLDVDNLKYSNEATPSFYHPGKFTTLKIKNQVVAHVGEIHPSILQKLKIETNVVAFELFIDMLPDNKQKTTQTFSDYQQVSRDFAFIVDKNLNSSNIIKAIKAQNSRFIKDIRIFDVYCGEELGVDKKSIAINVLLQAEEKTLSNEDISQISNEIIALVKNRTNAKLRDV